MRYNTDTLIVMAEQRARTYDWIIGTLMTLPDPEFLKSIRSDESRLFLEKYSALKQPSITKGCNLVLDFLEQTAHAEEQELLEQMSVDRTRLIRTPFAKAYPPPYEGQYAGAEGTASQLALKQLYQSFGYVPAEDKETLDFFAMELDFMRMLILKTMENKEGVAELLAAQKDFLENHPGRWITNYVQKAMPHAETNFYKGWLIIMEGFLELEKDYLGLASQGFSS